MGITSSVVWIIIGLVLIIAEMLSLTFILLFFGIAAFTVAICKYLGLNNLPLEIFLFASIGAVSLLLFRKKARLILSSARGIAIDRNKSVILSADLPARGSAEISYQGALWTAVNDSDVPLSKGSRVYIQGTDGVKLLVNPETVKT